MPADGSQPLSFPKTLGQILETSLLPQNSESTLSEQNPNLLTTGKAVAKPKPTGRPPSETVLGRLRSIAQSAQSGRLVDDQELEISLAQHFGSRLACSKKLDHDYSGPGGYDTRVVGNDVTVDCVTDAEMKLFDAVDFLNRPATPQFVAGKLAQLRAVMARTSESAADIEIVIATYADHVRNYPADIVGHVIDNCIHTKKWFPLVSELCSQMEALASFRRAVQKAFEEVRNPLLARKVEAKRIAADPRLGVHYKELPRKEWLPCHWDWWIGDAEKMVELWKSQGRATKADEWQVVLDQRIAEREAA